MHINSENKFYVYIHRKADDDSIFYIGKGQGKRAYHQNSYHRSKLWHQTVFSHGLKVEIIESFHSEKDALSFERYLIASYRLLNQPLINKTNGGQGLSGYEAPESVRLKHRSDALKSWMNPEFRNKNTNTAIKLGEKNWKSQEYRQKTVAGMRKLHADPVFKKKHAEKLAMMSKLNSKSFKNIETGMIFKNRPEAILWLKSLGFNTANQVSIGYALNGKYPTAYTYHWEYV